MKIEFIRQVKHAGRTHETGDVVTVAETMGEYFCLCGWSKRLDGDEITPQPPPEHVTLEVNGTNHNHNAQNVGEQHG